MRKTYDLDGLPHMNGSSSKDIAYSSYVEVARSVENPRARYVDTGYVPTLLVEPNTLLREGLRRILTETSYSLVASASSLDEARQMWVPNDQTFLVIVGASGNHDELFRQVKALKEELPNARVAVLVDQYDLKPILSAFQAKVDAYLVKAVSCEVLVKSLDLVMLGEAVYPSAILRLVHEHSPNVGDGEGSHDLRGDSDEEKLPAKGLSVRETVILRCLMEGDSNKIIARKFDITEATVKVHVKAILRKIRAKNRTQAAIWAASHLPVVNRVPASQ
ncbi:LuxR C-terminal-related transcriptional regulator [Microvirga roseola]|uniref:LuxR C-terminal-related transcriptional regulator n=1 Tax=Microvirga roseola TaxID=2883126 RepID=UPI001E469519|nr:response regulator transcription factor [Microvirga roseola]